MLRFRSILHSLDYDNIDLERIQNVNDVASPFGWIFSESWNFSYVLFVVHFKLSSRGGSL